MLKVGERVECIDKKSSYFGEKGTFRKWVANGLLVKFDSGSECLYLISDLKRI